jgi:hypothetical protein
MIWIATSEKDIATETLEKTPLGHRRTCDLLLPRLLSGHVELAEREATA